MPVIVVEITYFEFGKKESKQNREGRKKGNKFYRNGLNRMKMEKKRKCLVSSVT